MKTSLLTKFLNESRYDKSKHPEVTHTRMPDADNGIFGGSYYIPDEKWERFMELYAHEIVKRDKIEHLTEKQLPAGPILVDIDLRFNASIKTRQYTEDKIIELVDIYLHELKTIYQFDEDTKFTIYVMEKPRVNCLEDKTKDGIHLIIGINSDRNTQILLREKVLQHIPEWLETLPVENTIEDIVDKSIALGNSNWQLYGSCKPHHDTYELTKIIKVTFDTNDKEFILDNIMKQDFDIIANLPLLSARYPDHYSTFFTSAFGDKHKQFAETKKPKNTVVSEIKPKSESTIKYDEKFFQLALEEGLLNEFASSYDSWRDFAFILKNTFDDRTGLQFLIEFSKLDKSKFDEQRVTDYWNNNIKNEPERALGFGSLVNMCKKKKENAEKVKKIQKQISEEKKKDISENDESTIATDDEHASKILAKKLRNILVSTPQGRLFMKKDNVWICDKIKIEEFIFLTVLESGLRKYNAKTETDEPYAQNVSNAKNIAKALVVKVKRDNIVDIYDKFNYTTKNRICFKDGVLDFKAKKFYTWEEVDFEYYTTVQISYEFGEYFKNPNLEDVKTIEESIYVNMYGESVGLALKFISRGIAGQNTDKNFASYVGNRDCGKGVKYDNLKYAFEGYVGQFSLDNVLYERNTNKNPTSRELYWLMPLEFTRLAISQETPTPNSGLKVNTKLFKTITGGGDTIKCRNNYDIGDTDIKLQTTFDINGNNSLEFDSNDAHEHHFQWVGVCQFKTQAEIDQLKADGVDERIWSQYKIKDPNIKDNCRLDEWKKATVYLFYQNYVDYILTVPIDKDAEEGQKTMEQIILEKYIITGNEEDVIVADVIRQDLKGDRKKLPLTLKQLGVEKRKNKSRDELRDKICYFGIKRREEEVEEE